ncbi:MAG TPA: FAD/NAD(P)-binding oxidoreductase, partial [Aliiroseovarius sp.]|nr:FAD/NAD(P)-binding oxidoreductase [Aliiroseovarius sp.]
MEGALAQKAYDFAIVGAGVVGCALARRLTLAGARVLVLEKALDVLDGASKGNSAILHTGFDAPPGSLEQSCIAEGYKEYFEVADALGLPILKSGALVLAWTQEQLAQLPELVEKAHKNGVLDVQLLPRDEILRREPNLSSDVLGGFEVPGEYLIDPWTTAHAYILQAIENGAVLERGAEARAARREGDGWDIDTSAGAFRAATVINCAGLYGDRLDEIFLGETHFTVIPRKGQFVVFDKAASDLVSAIILPVPTKKTKGVVICRTIFGNVLVGPTAEDQTSRTDASTDRQTVQALRQTGIDMLPGLEHCEVTTLYAGLRPATDAPEYRIQAHEGQSYITVGGIRSTGLSGALGIAKHVCDKLLSLGEGLRPIASPKRPQLTHLSNYHTRDWETSGNGGIVCHCELVTRREIEAALNGPMPPNTFAGLKRRTRAAMGRCQGFYCTGELCEIT